MAGQHFTFPKKEQLLKKWELLRVYSGNKKYTGRYIVLYVLPNQPHRKVGIIVSSKLGNAVKRNRMKRIIREAYRLNKNPLPLNVHLIITGKIYINSLKYKELEKDLLNLYKEAGLLN